MDQANFLSDSLKQGAMLFMGAALFIGNAAYASLTYATTLINDESSFVFSGNCSGGERYRLFSYQKIVSGKVTSFYAYEGPVGNGAVQTETSPKVMAQRVCRKLAEIISPHYWSVSGVKTYSVVTK